MVEVREARAGNQQVFGPTNAGGPERIASAAGSTHVRTRVHAAALSPAELKWVELKQPKREYCGRANGMLKTEKVPSRWRLRHG